MPRPSKPLTTFGKEVEEFCYKTRMPATELARLTNQKYSTLMECKVGRSAGHELIPAVRQVMKVHGGTQSS